VKFLEWTKRFGKVYKFRGVFGTKTVVLTDPAAVDHVLGRDDVYNYPKPAGGRQWFKLLLGEGILWAEGHTHEKQRHTLAPAFNQQALRDLTPIFYDSAYKAVERWNELIDKSPNDTAEIDVQYWTNRISLDSIGLAGFSFDFGALGGLDHPLAQCLDRLTDSSAGSFTSFVVRAVLFTFPVILRMPIKRIQLLKAARGHLAGITSKVWKDALASGERGETGKTILELLVRADLARDGENMGEDEISAQIMTLIFAGYETTSCILSWTLHELALHPELQDQLRQEIAEHSSDPDLDDLQTKLPLLDRVVKEVLRLHAPVSELNRVATKDDMIPITTPKGAKKQFVHIPPGTLVCIPIDVMQTDPVVWGPDALEFKPDRWIGIQAEEKRNHEQNIKNPFRREIMAFSSGVRTCIGRTFALVEIKAVLTVLLKQYSFAPAKPIEPFVSFVVRPRVVGDKKSTLPLTVGKMKW
jgi:cytochrome P450